ncbi:MAG TPA: DUF6494 family protein [Burkholderiales bacterium]|nr:DUF6494 family protein [Burkholderiales bacterium]
MNEETFNMSIRKFLKNAGVRSQLEIEQAVTRAVQQGKVRGNEKLPAKMTLEIQGLELKVAFDGVIELE